MRKLFVAALLWSFQVHNIAYAQQSLPPAPVAEIGLWAADVECGWPYRCPGQHDPKTQIYFVNVTNTISFHWEYAQHASWYDTAGAVASFGLLPNQPFQNSVEVPHTGEEYQRLELAFDEDLEEAFYYLHVTPYNGLGEFPPDSEDGLNAGTKMLTILVDRTPPLPVEDLRLASISTPTVGVRFEWTPTRTDELRDGDMASYRHTLTLHRAWISEVWSESQMAQIGQGFVEFPCNSLPNDYDPCAQGKYIFTLVAVDNAGNESMKRSVAYSVP